jgi:ribose 5-phosphate isomerase A
MTTTDSPASPAALKRAAAAAALDYVQPGMKLGLGTGSTAEAFLDCLAPKVADGLKITGVPTSQRTADKARALGIPIAELDDTAPLDLTIDGADEADHALNLIKGGGGALLREKIVASSSARMVVIADGSKLVDTLGAFALPVEVVGFGARTTIARIEAEIARLGYGDIPISLRMNGDGPFISDSGHFIFDCAFGTITDAPTLARALSEIPGVVDHGLFINIASSLVVARPDGVEILTRTAS